MLQIYKEDDSLLLVNLNVTEANLGNADKFKKELLKLFDKKPKRIILNMEKVEYIDSSFLGALVSALKHMIALNCDLVLVGLRKDVADLFSLIRLDKVFKIYGSFDEVPAY